jgi:type II secretory pathway pseudopilin PulG
MVQTFWHLNPAWYALAIAIISLAISLFVYLIQRRTLKVNLQRGLVLQAAAINEAFVRYKVKSPYAHLLKIPDDKVESFTGKAVLLLNQINLLKDVHDNRRQLGSKIVASYEKWATTIVSPWIESDDELRLVWGITKESKDWMGEDFVGWLEKLFPWSLNTK